jgi:hypothetical protein
MVKTAKARYENVDGGGRARNLRRSAARDRRLLLTLASKKIAPFEF